MAQPAKKKSVAPKRQSSPPYAKKGDPPASGPQPTTGTLAPSMGVSTGARPGGGGGGGGSNSGSNRTATAPATETIPLTWEEIPGSRVRRGPFSRICDVCVASHRIFAVSNKGQLFTYDLSRLDPTIHVTELAQVSRCIAVADDLSVGWVGNLILSQVGGAASPEDRRLPRLLALKFGSDGPSWTPVQPLPIDSPYGVCSISLVDANTAYACGTFPRGKKPGIWTTSDGRTWSATNVPDDWTGLTDIHFQDAKAGIVVGAIKGADDEHRPLIARTKNGGQNWVALPVPDTGPDTYVWKLAFAADGSAWMASIANVNGPHGIILKSTDRGATWERIDVVEEQAVKDGDLQGIGFADDQTGWTCGRDQFALETTDGGHTWTRSRVLKNLNRIVFTERAIIAVGDAIYWKRR